MFETIGAVLVVIACGISVAEEVYYHQKSNTEYAEVTRSDVSDAPDDESDDN